MTAHANPLHDVIQETLIKAERVHLLLSAKQHQILTGFRKGYSMKMPRLVSSSSLSTKNTVIVHLGQHNRVAPSDFGDSTNVRINNWTMFDILYPERPIPTMSKVLKSYFYTLPFAPEEGTVTAAVNNGQEWVATINLTGGQHDQTCRAWISQNGNFIRDDCREQLAQSGTVGDFSSGTRGSTVRP